LQEGLLIVRKLHTAADLNARCTSIIDLLPHDGARFFVDRRRWGKLSRQVIPGEAERLPPRPLSGHRHQRQE
jgi:hypothetical protein